MFVVYVHGRVPGFLTNQKTVGGYPWLAESVASATFFPTLEKAEDAEIFGIPGATGKTVSKIELREISRTDF